MKLYGIKKSNIDKKGRGLYATKDIKEGTRIIDYVGKIITKKQTEESEKFNNIFNIPLPAGTTSEEYLNAYEFVLKKVNEFKPEFILLSAGFDAHKDDPLAQLQLESKDFYEITKRTLELSKLYCDGKVVSILEGGYDLKALQESTELHVNALLEFN